MKSVELHIAQVEADPNRLYWRLSNDGIVTSGVFEVSTTDDIARFTACAAHVFNQIKTFKGDHDQEQQQAIS